VNRLYEAQIIPQGFSYMHGPKYVALVYRRKNVIVKLRLRKMWPPVQVWVSSF